MGKPSGVLVGRVVGANAGAFDALQDILFWHRMSADAVRPPLPGATKQLEVGRMHGHPTTRKCPVLHAKVDQLHPI
jgi:hypothetical protein